MTMMDAPFDNLRVDIWTTGSVSKSIPRVDEIFDIHGKETIQSPEMLNAHGCVVWMQEVNENVYYSQRFPIHDLERKYGKVFTCSMSMMLAYAYMRGYRNITLYGVDMALSDEYEKFRANFLYLLGLGRGEGRNVKISSGSLLMKDALTYSYDQPSINDQHVIAYTNKIEQRLAETRQEADRIAQESSYLRGALDAIRELRKVYGGK